MGLQIKIGNFEFSAGTTAKTTQAPPNTGAQVSATPQQRSIDAPFKYDVDSLGNHTYELTSPDFARQYKAMSGEYSDANLVEMFNCVPEIFAPINEIASRVAAATWQLCKEWNDEVDHGNSQFNRLFSKPNPLVPDFRTFVWLDCVYELLLGKSFHFFGGVGVLGARLASVTKWFILPAHYVSVKYRSPLRLYSATELADIVEEFRIADYNDTKSYAPTEILPIVTPKLEVGTGPLDGSSLVAKSRLALVNLLAVYEARGIIYLKQGALGILVSRKTDDGGVVALSPAEKGAVLQDLHETYGVTGRRSPIAVTNQPVDFVKTASSIKDLEPFTETMTDAAAIYSCLRVPRHLMPGFKPSTYANQQGDMRSFYDGVIIPMAERRALAWTEFLNLRELDRRYIRPNFDHIAELQEDKKARAERENKDGLTWKTRFDNGVCSLNDWINSFNGTPGTSSMYGKKKYELLPEELALINPIVAQLSENSNARENKQPKTGK